MQTLYAKLNRDRLPQFQIETKIFRDSDGKVTVRKKPLNSSASGHISEIHQHYEAIRNKVHYEIPSSHLENDHLYFEYIDGIPYDSLLLDSLSAGGTHAFYQKLENYMGILKANSVLHSKFYSCDEFKEIFCVEVELDNVFCQEPSNVDMTFDNLLIVNDRYYFIDYEWIFYFPIPTDYIAYRSINFFFKKYCILIGNKVALKDVWDYLGYQEPALKLFELLETNFQNYVLGPDRLYTINSNYCKKNTSFTESVDHIKNNDAELERCRLQLDDNENNLALSEASRHELEAQLDAERAKLVDYCAKVDEIERKISGRDAIIAEQDHRITELLNSYSWRITAPLRWVARALHNFCGIRR